MAEALDTSSVGVSTATTPLVWSHTCTGNNLILYVGICCQASGTPNVSGVTYNGVAMTLVGVARAVAATAQLSLWQLINPPTGAHNVSAAFTGTIPNCNGAAVSYTNVQQSAQPDATNGATGSASVPTIGVTTIADNCWVVGFMVETATSAPPAGNLTVRRTGAASTVGFSLQDTNAAQTPPGAVTVSWATTASSWGVQAASFVPIAVGGSFVPNIPSIGVP